MAENKKSIIVYADWIELFNSLSDDEAGRLIKHFFKYVNDLNPQAPDRITELSFIPIKQSLKRDLKKWDEIKIKRSEAGKASAEKRKQNSTNSTSVESVQQNSTNPTVNVNDSVNVNDINNNTNLSVDWDKLRNNFNELTGKKTLVVSDKVKRQIKARLKEGYTKQDLWNAIVNCFNDPYHKENPRYLTLEFISRSDKMEKYCTDIKKQKPKEDRL